MPLTPLHGLAPMFLYFRNKKGVDPLALTVSVTFIDLEPLYYYLLAEPFDHRILHGFALALTIYPIIVTFGVYMIERFCEEKLWHIHNALLLKPDRVQYPILLIYLVSLLGAISHIFFDMFTHEIMPYVIYPLVYGNPFYARGASLIVELAVILLATYSCVQWLRRRRCQNSGIIGI